MTNIKCFCLLRISVYAPHVVSTSANPHMAARAHRTEGWLCWKLVIEPQWQRCLIQIVVSASWTRPPVRIMCCQPLNCDRVCAATAVTCRQAPSGLPRSVSIQATSSAVSDVVHVLLGYRWKPERRLHCARARRVRVLEAVASVRARRADLASVLGASCVRGTSRWLGGACQVVTVCTWQQASLTSFSKSCPQRVPAIYHFDPTMVRVALAPCLCSGNL